MTFGDEEIPKQLSKEQLIYLIEQMSHSLTMIGEVCVDESKCHIESNEAVSKIREYIYDIPSLHDFKSAAAFIDWKLGKISVKEYKRIIGLE